MAPIIDYTPAQTVSPYAAMIKDELEALLAAGENKATEVKVPTVDKGKFKLAFSRAANALDKTARYRVEEDDGKTRKDKDKAGNPIEVPAGDTRFVITLSKRHAARRGEDTTEEANAE